MESDTGTPLDEVATVTCGTTAGEIVLEFHRPWSPHGYDQAVQLFEKGFYDETHFFRTVPGFLVQFGMSYTSDKDLMHLGNAQIPDDPQLDPPIRFTKGTISYAGSGPNSRTSQLFISLMSDGGSFGTQLWESPVGQVVQGMDTVSKFYSGYGDMPPWGKGPIQDHIRTEGQSYIRENFPLIDSFYECHVKRSSEHGDHEEQKRRREVEQGGRPISGDAYAAHQQVEHTRHVDPHDAHRTNIRVPSGQKDKSHREHHDHGHHEHPNHEPTEPQRAAGEQRVTGELHHQHSVHFNAAPNEEGLTKLSWELVASCLVLFLAVFLLWLRIALRVPTTKSRKTS